MPLIDVEVTDNIGFICLNNPGKRNALSHALGHEIIQTLHDFKERKIAAVILRAPDGCSVWSAGHDIKELPEVAPRPARLPRFTGKTAPSGTEISRSGYCHGSWKRLGRRLRSRHDVRYRHRGRNLIFCDHPGEARTALQCLRHSAFHQQAGIKYRQGDVLFGRPHHGAKGPSASAYSIIWCRRISSWSSRRIWQNGWRHAPRSPFPLSKNSSTFLPAPTP